METRNLYQPFEVVYAKTDDYTSREHRNTFFEMIFILDGNGVHHINDQRLPYAPDKLFLLFPEDRHGFDVDKMTEFLFIRFNDSYLKKQRREWAEKLEFIFHHHSHQPRCILNNITDKPLVRSLAEALMREQAQDSLHQQEVMTQLINTLITVAARNIALGVHHGVPEQSSASLNLLNYIHRNISSPAELRIPRLAAHFNLSPAYIGEYFKKQTGEPLQQYITRYKLKMIESRLLYTNMRMNEIALEFGFTDESHLNRIFKKYSSMSPSAFRKKENNTQQL